MNITNFDQQNEFNENIFEVLQNHFTYEEESRKLIGDLAANVTESTKAVAKLAKSLSGRQTRLGIGIIALGVIGYKKIRDLEKRLEKVEEQREE